MKEIILDTNIIVRYPKVLSKKGKWFKFIITGEVLRELRNKVAHNNIGRLSFNNDIISLIYDASERQSVELVLTPSDQISISQNFEKISGADIDILLYGLYRKKKGGDIVIATQDKELIKRAKENNINTFDLDELIEFSVSQKEDEQNISKEAERIEQKDRKFLYSEVAVGVIASVIVNLLINNKEALVNTINVWGTITLAIGFGFGLFYFREKWRLSYGVLEFLVGVVTIIGLFYPSFDYDKVNFSLDFNFKILGGLYIMVRGQDNIIKGLKGRKAGYWIEQKLGIKG